MRNVNMLFDFGYLLYKSPRNRFKFNRATFGYALILSSFAGKLDSRDRRRMVGHRGIAGFPNLRRHVSVVSTRFRFR